MALAYTYDELGRPEKPGNVRLPEMPTYVEAEIPFDTFEDWKRVKFSGCLYFEPMDSGESSNELYMALSFGPC
jgi:hypothetical protein